MKYMERYRYRHHGQTPLASHLKLVLILVLGGLTLVGCGVKGPPIPLRQPPALPAVTDLACHAADHKVTLSWRLSPLDRQAARQARFIIRRSRTAFDQPACENCPQVFETVGNIPYVETADGSYTMRLSLEAGFRYGFTVHLQMGNVAGPDSDPVHFDYPPDKQAGPVEAP